MSLVFGCDVTSSTLSWGVFQNHSKSEKVDVLEPRNEEGKIVEHHAYSKTTEHKLDFLINGVVPSAGTSLAIAGDTVIVTDTEAVRANTEKGKGTLTGHKSDSATITAYA